MRDPSRVRVGRGPLKSYVQGFRGELELQGYARGTVVLHPAADGASETRRTTVCFNLR